MAASSSATTIISGCCLGPPVPPKEAATDARRPPAGVSVSSYALRRACVAAAACAVMGTTGGGTDMALALARDGVVASRIDAAPVTARAPPRWSDRRPCPPWRANSLENVVPENLPRPSAPKRFSSVSDSAAEGGAAAPDLVAPAPSSLALRPAARVASLSDATGNCGNRETHLCR